MYKDKTSTEKIFFLFSPGMHVLPYTSNKLFSSKTYIFVCAHLQYNSDKGCENLPIKPYILLRLNILHHQVRSSL